MRLQKTAALAALLLAAVSLISAPTASAHCQVPCGIFDDAARIAEMKEDTVTIAKATKLINELAGKTDPTSVNQLNRWVMNKELHASKIITTISEYYLAQRIKPVAPTSEEDPSYKDYLVKLAKHHAVMIAAMKSKQQPTDAAIAKLNAAIDAIAPYYPKPHDHDHDH